MNEIKLSKFIKRIPNLYEIRYYNVFENYWRVDLWCEFKTESYRPVYSICDSYFLLIRDGELVDKTIRGKDAT